MPFRSSHIASHGDCSSLMPIQGRSHSHHHATGGRHPVLSPEREPCTTADDPTTVVDDKAHPHRLLLPGGVSCNPCSWRVGTTIAALLPLGSTLCLCCWGVPGHLVLDSGLDAFSQYPSHGSFATPASRLIAETRGAA